MSNRVEQFQNHDFHNQLIKLQEAADAYDIKGITIDQSIELVRLKKVIRYIINYFKKIDPDILTSQDIQAMGNMRDYTVRATSYVNQRDINSSNANMDQVLKIITAFRTPLKGTGKQSISTMLSAYDETIKNSLDHIDLPSAVRSSEAIKALKEKLIDGNEEELGIEEQIDNALKDTIEKHNELIEYYHKTLNGENENTTKAIIEKAKNDISIFLETAKKESTEISDKIQKLDEFYVKIFGEINSETGKRAGGLQSELDIRKAQLDKFEKEAQLKYTELNNQINSLLDGATSVGLAKAYKNERDKFVKPIWYWNITFIVSLIAIAVISLMSIISFFFFETGDIRKISDLSISTLRTLPITGSLIWLAVYASKRRSENQRLEQEYAHKEALAKSYTSYKNQIAELQDDDPVLLKKLLEATINTVAYNPSVTLEKKHGDGTPVQEIVKNVVEGVKAIKL